MGKPKTKAKPRAAAHKPKAAGRTGSSARHEFDMSLTVRMPSSVNAGLRRVARRQKIKIFSDYIRSVFAAELARELPG